MRRVEVPRPEGSLYKAMDSSFMQGSVFLDFIRTFDNLICNNLKDDKLRILILDGQVSHITLELLEFAFEYLYPFQLSSHYSDVTQPLDVYAFGIFNLIFSTALNSFVRNKSDRIPVNGDIAGLVSQVDWVRFFTS